MKIIQQESYYGTHLLVTLMSFLTLKKIKRIEALKQQVEEEVQNYWRQI
ncbi:hypothetical protein [Halobacillus sp. B29]